MDARQFPQWGDFLSRIGWIVEQTSAGQVFIRKLPLTGGSIIKCQRLTNPLPYKELDMLAKKYKALCTVVEPHPKNYDMKVLSGNGYRVALDMSYTQTATIQIDLTMPEEKLFKSFSENARRNIKKAQKNNLKIETVFLKDKNRDQAYDKFYNLLRNLTHLKKFYVPSYKEFYQKMLAFKDSSVIFFAYHQDNPEPVACVWMGYHQDTAVYMHTGITEEGYKLLANYLLVWEALKLAKRLKLRRFDFEGIYDPRFPKLRRRWQHFSEFKGRFHGQVIEYPEPWIKLYNPVFKLIYLWSKLLPN